MRHHQTRGHEQSKQLSATGNIVVAGAFVGSLLAMTGYLDDAIVHAGKGALSVTGYEEGGNQGEAGQPAGQTEQLATEDNEQQGIYAVIDPIPAADHSDVAPQELTTSDDCLGNTYDGWYFDPIGDSIIDSLPDYSEEQKTFLKFSLRGVCEVKRAGALTNPKVDYDKASVESNTGQDTLAPYFNYNGNKMKEGQPYVEAWTQEDYGNGNVRVKQKFRVYDHPMGSYWDSAEMFGRLDWYKATITCRHDDDAYRAELQHDVNVDTCEIERYQGEEGVLSYATQGTKPGEVDYEDILEDRGEDLRSSEYIYRP